MILNIDPETFPTPERQPGDRYRIGVTGGIGTGKTYVANLIHLYYGIPVYDTDREAKRLMQTSPEIRQKLTELIGPEAYLPGGVVNRELLREFIFDSQSHVAEVNAIVHPVVRRDFLEWTVNVQLTPTEAALQQRHFRREVVAVESALLVEAHMTDDVDRVVQVDADIITRLHRAMRRDGLSEQDVFLRMAHQLTYSQRMPFVHHVIMNDDKHQDLIEQIERFINYTKEEAGI